MELQMTDPEIPVLIQQSPDIENDESDVNAVLQEPLETPKKQLHIDYSKLNVENLTKLTAIMQIGIGSLCMAVHLYKRCDLAFQAPAHWITSSSILSMFSGITLFIYLATKERWYQIISIYLFILTLFSTLLSMFLFLNPRFTLTLLVRVFGYHLSHHLSFCIMSLGILTIQYTMAIFHVLLLWLLV